MMTHLKATSAAKDAMAAASDVQLNLRVACPICPPVGSLLNDATTASDISTISQQLRWFVKNRIGWSAKPEDLMRLAFHATVNLANASAET
jgi:hypothetical protein